MKFNQKKFYDNLIENAKDVYIRVYTMAQDSDYSNKTSLDKVDERVFKYYYKYYKKPKRLFHMLVCTAGIIYNREVIADGKVCYDLNILLTIAKRRLYKPHKFIQFIESRGHYDFIVPGVNQLYLNNLINKLLEGVKC